MSLETYIKATVKAAVLEALAEFRQAAPASQPPAPSAAPQSTSPAAASAAPEAGAYEPIGALIKKLAPTNHAKVLAILQKHDAKKGSQLKPETYPAVLKALQALDG